MKFLKINLVLIATLFGIGFVKAQTADDIINKYINAIGGKEKLSKITSLYTESTSDGMGQKMEIATTIVNGKGFKNEMDINGSKMVQCFTDTSGWMINGIAGETNAEPFPKELIKNQKGKMEVLLPLVNYAERGYKVTLLPSEKIGDINAYKILITTAADSSNKTIIYIDPTTYYAIKSVSEVKVPGQESNFIFTMLMSNYQKTDYGYSMPFTTEAIMPQGSMTMIVKKVEVNKVVDPKIFDMPK